MDTLCVTNLLHNDDDDCIKMSITFLFVCNRMKRKLLEMPSTISDMKRTKAYKISVLIARKKKYLRDFDFL